MNLAGGKTGIGAALIAAMGAAIVGGCSDKDGTAPTFATERTCAGAQAISTADLHGTALPPKTLSLSFDDGPGVRTGELSTYLKSQGIAASFFVNGKMLGHGTAVLQQLVADGHVIGNHTQTHTSLTGRSTGGAPLLEPQVIDEVAQTDALIAPFVGNRFMFRAPFGDFDMSTAAAIGGSAMKKYVGPINWEIGDHMGPAQAADWDCWTPGADGVVLTPEQCGDLYVAEIESVGRGIVLLHDPYFIDDDPTKGGTVDLVKHIVPVLKAKGYTFIRTDEVPAISALLPALPKVAGDAGAGSSTDAGASASGPTATGADELGAATPDPCAPRP